MKLRDLLRGLRQEQKFVVKKIEQQKKEAFISNVQDYLNFNVSGLDKVNEVLIVSILIPKEKHIDKEKLPTMTISELNLEVQT